MEVLWELNGEMLGTHGGMIPPLTFQNRFESSSGLTYNGVCCVADTHDILELVHTLGSLAQTCHAGLRIAHQVRMAWKRDWLARAHSKGDPPFLPFSGEGKQKAHNVLCLLLGDAIRVKFCTLGKGLLPYKGQRLTS